MRIARTTLGTDYLFVISSLYRRVLFFIVIVRLQDPDRPFGFRWVGLQIPFLLSCHHGLWFTLLAAVFLRFFAVCFVLFFPHRRS